MIEFKRISGDDAVADYLASTINKHLLKGQKVLWMVAGGSAMGAALKASRKLKGSPNLSGLTVTLTDERYGPVGHQDSNWKQLIDKGFSLPGAVLAPILIDKGLNETVSGFKTFLAEALSGADYSVALAGMGPDGHIFGIKPGSPSVDSHEIAVGYNWDDYTRITPTAGLIRRLDDLVVYAAGSEKHAQIDRLDGDITAREQPAQLLKQAKRVSFFNDYKGEAA